MCWRDSEDYPLIEGGTAPFAYARLMRSREEVPTGYPAEELGHWSQRAKAWSAAGQDVFVFFINGFKPHAPAAACAFLELNAGGR